MFVKARDVMSAEGSGVCLLLHPPVTDSHVLSSALIQPFTSMIRVLFIQAPIQNHHSALQTTFARPLTYEFQLCFGLMLNTEPSRHLLLHESNTYILAVLWFCYNPFDLKFIE